MNKVLIITYYWPPAGGPGVQRWLKFVKYLPDFNIQPIVYIPENPTYPIIDQGLLNELPANVVVLKQKINEPYSLASFFSKKNTTNISSGIIPNQKKQTLLQKILLWVRGNFFIPDARVMWVKPSVAYLSNYIQSNNIKTIITTGPPHSLHLIGLELKQKLPIKWIADFRDPWTTIGYHKALKLSKYASKKHKILENKVLNLANSIIVTSPTTKNEFQILTNTPITVITNGFDDYDFEKQTLDKKFSLAHIGSFLSDRNPHILWQCISELLIEVPTFDHDLEIKLVGAVSQEVFNTISEYKLYSYVNYLGYLSHKEAIIHQKKSQVLLIIEIDKPETKSIIPGKIFEYITSNRPIIGIGPQDSDFASIINETQTGIFCYYTDKDKLKQYIVSCYHLFLNNKLEVLPVNLLQYSRKNLTKQLSSLL